MKQLFMVVMICFAAASCTRRSMPSSATYINSEIHSKQGDTILAGHCAVSMLQQQPYKTWFDKSYDAYTPDSLVVSKLKPLLADKTIDIFLGSWCGDSKREMPRMLKTLAGAGFDTAHIRLIFVDHAEDAYKQSPQHEEAGKTIFRVPTFIVYNSHGEMGRIIESPVATLEQDLLAILQQQPYTPHYNAVHYWNKHTKPGKILSQKALQSLAATIKPMCQDLRPFNSYGYVLLSQQHYTAAINVFKLNALMFPENYNAFDSLGEAYAKMGDKPNAKENYTLALKLKPGDERIQKILQDL